MRYNPLNQDIEMTTFPSFISAVLVGIILIYHGEAQRHFNYNSVFTCATDFQSAQGCQKWTVSMSIAQDISCFPAQQLVPTKVGLKRMADLDFQDELLAYDYVKGQKVYTPMKAWLHNLSEDTFKTEYLKISTSEGSFFISGMHNIAVQKTQTHEFMFAKDLEIGDPFHGNQSSVSSIETSTQYGLYAPLTDTFNFYIAANDQNNEESLILVHCFANIEHPVLYEGVFSLFERVLNYLGIRSHGSKSADGISPVAKAMMKTFPKLVQRGARVKNQGETSEDALVLQNGSTDNDNDNTEIQAILTFIAILSNDVLGQ